MATGSIIFYPNFKKRSKRDDKVPMYLRIVWNRTKAETRLALEYTDKDLVKWNNMIMRFEDRNSPDNEKFIEVENRFNEIIRKYLLTPDSVTAIKLRNELMNTDPETQDSLLDYCNKYIEKAVTNNSTLAVGTKKNYLKAMKHLTNFLYIRSSLDYKLKDVNVTFANDFYDYLINNDPVSGRKGMTEVSAGGNIKRIKTILERAYNEEKINRNSFKALKLKSRSPKKEKLNSVDVAKLFHHDLSEFKTLEKVRDIFLFSLFTGLAYLDTMLLKQQQIQIWTNNEMYLNSSRVKTDIDTRQFLVSPAKEIIEKYKDSADLIRSGGIMPKISNQQYNLRIKVVAEKVGITKNLTTHVARHSFRQMLAEAGIREAGIIKTMMGHSVHGDIDSVYYDVSEKSLLQTKEQFEEYLTEILNND